MSDKVEVPSKANARFVMTEDVIKSFSMSEEESHDLAERIKQERKAFKKRQTDQLNPMPNTHVEG